MDKHRFSNLHYNDQGFVGQTFKIKNQNNKRNAASDWNFYLRQMDYRDSIAFNVSTKSIMEFATEYIYQINILNLDVFSN